MRAWHLLPLLLCVMSSGTCAAEFCVTTSQQLVDALATADSNGQDDVIRIASGSYDAPNAGGYVYLAAAAPVENHSLNISGGWTDFFGNPCGQQAGSTPYDTLINANGGRVLGIFEGTASSITGLTISNLTISGGDSTGAGAGLHVTMTNSTGDIHIDRCAFIGNRSDSGSAMTIRGNERIELRNSVVVANTAVNAGVQSSAVFITTSGNKGIYLINNTIVNNQIEAAGSPLYGGAYLVANAPANTLVVNNILWGNEGIDLAAFGSGNAYFHHNDIESGVGNNLEQLNNISVMPTYSGGLLNFTPASDSALIDAGREPPFISPFPVPFDDDWSTGTTDFAGNPRIRGHRVDIGAYEGLPSTIFADGFE